MKKHFLFFAFFISFLSCSQETNEMSLIFVGDIMGHGPQINAAYDSKTKKYDYSPVFEKVKPILSQNDFGIGNLEVTLGGAPYTGYPTFSSPDALAVACKENNLGFLITANNHSCDRGKKGILRTIQVLDSLNMPHTGTFADIEERNAKNLLILDKNNIRVGILNYTYGTNGIPIPKPTIVNLIDIFNMKWDIEEARNQNIDKLIVCIHWGNEYQQKPNSIQKYLADFLFQQGVDIIVGGHPHVLQPMEYFEKNENQKERLVAYSLGNFISNQRKPNTDGGAMLQITLKKENNETFISKKGYYLTWVRKFEEKNRLSYQILPCFSAEKQNFNGLKKEEITQIQLFMNNSRKLFAENTISIPELTD